MKKSVMIIWKGFRWDCHEITTNTGLADDLPATIEAPTPSRLSSEPETYTFVLAGRCGDVPLYKQV